MLQRLKNEDLWNALEVDANIDMRYNRTTTLLLFYIPKHLQQWDLFFMLLYRINNTI